MSTENAIATLDADTNKALAMIGADIDEIAKNIDESAGEVQKVQQALPGFKSFAKFMRSGAEGPVSPWQYGREDEERQIRPDSKWLVDFSTLQWGWSGYKKANGATGDLIKGQTPDQFLVPYHACPPAPPADMPWVQDRCVRFLAMCVEEGADLPEKLADERVESKGDVIEVTIHQKMASGFVELVNDVRERVQMVSRAKKAGNANLLRDLVTSMYPLVTFNFKLRVKAGGYVNSKPILERVGWGSPIVNFDETPAGPETPAEDLGEAIDAAKAETDSATPEAKPAGNKSRRSRSQ